MIKKNLPQFIIAFIIIVLFSLINIFHVIIGFIRSPIGFQYLGTGHYFLDYFVYLQGIGQGIQGKLFPLNYLNTTDNLIQLRLYPYLFLGYIARSINFSPQAMYWLSVFLLNFILLIVILYVFKLLLNKSSWLMSIFALLIWLSASPFYKINYVNGGLELIAADFWYGPSILTRRLEVIPYHVIASILIILTMITVCRVIESKGKKIFKPLLISCGILVILAFLSPFNLILLMGSIIFTTVFYLLIWLYKDKKITSSFVKLSIFIIISTLIGLIMMIIIKYMYGSSDLYQRISALEIQWQDHSSISFILFNIGPQLLLILFGFKNYFKKLTPIKLIFISFTGLSYLLYLSPIAIYLGTHNLRFLTIINYIFFASLAINGINQLRLKFNFQFVILFLIISYGLFYNGYVFYKRVNNQDLSTPVTQLSYVSNDLYKGLDILGKQKDGYVLTAPYQYVGMLIPSYSHKRVYIGREIETPNFELKQHFLYQFYSGRMSNDEASFFVKSNKISYVVLTDLDGFYSTGLRYPFLKKIYGNKSIIIWRII